MFTHTERRVMRRQKSPSGPSGCEKPFPSSPFGAGPGEETMVGDEARTWAIPDIIGRGIDPTASVGCSSSSVTNTYDYMTDDQESDRSSQTPPKRSSQQKTTKKKVHRSIDRPHTCAVAAILDNVPRYSDDQGATTTTQ